MAVGEGRLDHGLSQRQLARLSGVSRPTIAKIEAGGHVHPALVVRLAAALLVLDVHRQPGFDDDVDTAPLEGLRLAAVAGVLGEHSASRNGGQP